MRKQRIKLLIQILALRCPSFAHHRFSLYLPLQGTSRAARRSGPRVMAGFKALRELSFHSAGGLCSFDKPSANSRNRATSEGSWSSWDGTCSLFPGRSSLTGDPTQRAWLPAAVSLYTLHPHTPSPPLPHRRQAASGEQEARERCAETLVNTA